MSVEDAAQIFLSTPSARRATPPNSSRCPCTCRPFLSTPSARRATRGNSCFMGLEVFLSTPSARRATAACPEVPDGFAISIHALREEGDVCLVLLAVVVQSISIHALREEGDGRFATWLLSSHDFYPRPPRGGRPSDRAIQCQQKEFLSTPSARRATFMAELSAKRCKISIHALREEGDTSTP